MANRDNHYEAAFEAYLRARCVTYVAIDESRRTQLGDESLKSLDFIVHGRRGCSWLVDVKGRRFPAGGEQKQYWKNWSTRDDLRAMAAWENLFGATYQALFVFAYAIAGDRSPLPAEQLFEFRGRLYAFVGVRLGDYACYTRPISAAWQTVALTGHRFREVARSFDEFVGLVGVPSHASRSSGVDLGAPAATMQTSQPCDRAALATLTPLIGIKDGRL